MTWSAGAVLTAALLNSYLPQTWSTFTPTWTGSGGNPAIGDGIIDGTYFRAGDTTAFRISITMGSTTTFGSGAWALSLPEAPNAAFWTFNAHYRDSGTGAITGLAAWSSGSLVELLCPPTSAGTYDRSVTPTAPFTWATNDSLTVHGLYKAAS